MVMSQSRTSWPSDPGFAPYSPSNAVPTVKPPDRGRFARGEEAPGGLDSLGSDGSNTSGRAGEAGGRERLAAVSEVGAKGVRPRPARPLALPPGRPLVVETEGASGAGRPLVRASGSPVCRARRAGRRGSAPRSSAAGASRTSSRRVPVGVTEGSAGAGSSWPQTSNALARRLFAEIGANGQAERLAAHLTTPPR